MPGSLLEFSWMDVGSADCALQLSVSSCEVYRDGSPHTTQLYLRYEAWLDGK
jgi:hypothetical protein